MSDARFCFLCGTPIDGSRPWPEWMRRFRAVYTEDALNEVWDSSVPARLSGVARMRSLTDKVPVDDAEGARLVRISLFPCSLEGPMLAVPGPTNETAQGYPIHDHCWKILVAVRASDKIDAQVLLDVLRSFPVQGGGIVNFGHDYGGVAQDDEDMVMSGTVAAGKERSLGHSWDHLYPQTDPLNVPTLRRLFENATSFHDDGEGRPPLRSHDGPTQADVFSVLPEETLASLFEMLPSADVDHLRQASRICAGAALRDSFWRTRFDPGREFDYVTGAVGEYPIAATGRWKSLYLLAKVIRDGPEVENRRRVCGLAHSLRRLVDVAAGAYLRGDRVGSSGGEHWVTASRSHCALNEMFTKGSRSLWTRALSVPTGASVYVSCVDVFGARYVSGIRFESCDGEERDLGYMHNTTLVSRSTENFGFLLAQDERGIRGLSVLSSKGSLDWVWDHENLPKRRLVLPPKHGPIRYLKGGFDRLKLVSLSVSDGRPKKGRAPTTPLRDSAIWYPDVLDPHLSVIGIRTLGDDNDTPVTTAIFGGRDGEALGSVSSVAFRFDTEDGDGGSLLGLKVSFTNGLESVDIGVDTGRRVNAGGDAEGAVLPGLDEADDEENEEDEEDEEYSEGPGAGVEEELTFSIDGESGERIVGIDEIHRSKYVNRAVRVRTNRGRSAEFPPPFAEEVGKKYHSVKPLQPKKGVVVGFCSRVSSMGGLGDVGLVCTGDALEG